ncbi:MAG: flagellar assembly protein FliH [Rhodoferax sp.]|uniref:FliH/SctL family protein n=1 Tax=Rhodoferax sp. TaxID=50421 RepID=UPI0017D10327|nr:flagellar assembly protein FliH [Rhodoferax sp.]NMM15488.1 flagellar assembly protein FliH [Rhodoferax sp.]NMM20316.1 flagellar assembly protein FliH [Rhodoferax sp.]
MRNYARFIPGEEIGAVEHWNFGAVDTAALKLAAQVKAVEKATDQVKEDELKQAGYAEGFIQGHAQATLESQRQISEFIATQGQEAAQHFGQIFVTTQSQLADAEQVMARGVLELACELARQVLRHELSVNPNALQSVIREALGLLVAENKSALVRLNPLDLEVLEEVLRTEFSTLSLTLLADAAVTRGGCLIESAGTVVDGTLEKRWMRAIANLGLNSPWEDAVVEQ